MNAVRVVAGAVFAASTLAACGRPPPQSEPRAPEAAGSVVAVVDASPAPDSGTANAIAAWTRGSDGGDTWLRSAGAHAPPLVTRGVVLPTEPTEIPRCEGMDGARFGAAPLRLRLEGGAVDLHVWARARGPLGLLAESPDGASCALGAADAWARLDVPAATGDVVVRIADVDRAGARRGQTSPFVLVVTDDDRAPDERPEPRAPLGANDVTVRWELSPVSCPALGEPDGWVCARASLALGGAVHRVIPMKHPVGAQSGYWPDGTGILCGGASGQRQITLDLGADGAVRVSEDDSSDGYCENPADCHTQKAWTTFRLRPGLRLVPDPEGTFPPAPR